MIDGVATNRILSCLAGAFVGFAVLFLHDGITPRCVPNHQPSCACPNGTSAYQVCKEDGRSYTTCDCAK
jgi:hypothetical protein